MPLTPGVLKAVFLRHGTEGVFLKLYENLTPFIQAEINNLFQFEENETPLVSFRKGGDTIVISDSKLYIHKHEDGNNIRVIPFSACERFTWIISDPTLYPRKYGEEMDMLEFWKKDGEKLVITLEKGRPFSATIQLLSRLI